MNDIRDNLKLAISRSGFKQCVIAEKVGLTSMTLSSTLNKRRKLDANEMFAICAVLNITPEQLFGIQVDTNTAS